jgi:hypothetical protein
MISEALMTAAAEAQKLEDDFDNIKNKVQYLENRVAYLETERNSDNGFWKDIIQQLYDKYCKM